MSCMSKPFAATNCGSVLNSARRFHFRFAVRIKMSSSHAIPPLPENRVVVRNLFPLSLSLFGLVILISKRHASQVGYGMTTVDFLATVDRYPQPDDKIRSSSLKPKLISKVADDAHGFAILKELEADGVDTSFIVVSKGGSSTFSYVLVDNQTKTRTSIYTPGEPPLMRDDLPQSTLLSAFDGARLVYFDGMFPETALFVAQEVAHNNIPILVEAESPREGLDELLKLADFVVCSARFPQVAWTQAPSIPSALISMLLRLPNINSVIVTLGEDGCLMLERSANGKAMKFRAHGIGTICGRFYIGTAEKIPDSELIDTTGAGDAFIGAILYAICANMVPEKMLPLAAQVAAAKCRALGARSGLPRWTDPRLASFL
ncbi:hypothetical protein Fmac_006230 [Flemingia macrophylla]|uniref:Carbohydrate kinase PfkB domain-containing protein n=1 Tax=Flemingia macrophylla TaxID=520843 RepID=A0ABD1NCS7_9FABA